VARAFSPEDDLAAAVGLLRRLVAFDTVSPRSNLALIAAIADYLRSHGVEAISVEGGNADKAGLVARIGPSVSGGVVLSGHTDVVPVQGQRWSSDPFTLVERDGCLYGRGSADMKGFIAAVLASVPLFAAKPLRVPVHLAFSYDEEVGCLGAPRVIDALQAEMLQPALVIVGEPTGLEVADRHRGIATFVTSIATAGGHSSSPRPGSNAIALAARFVAELEQLGQELAPSQAPDHGPPEYTTVNIGIIEGGSAVNMIAENCRIVWECRPEPGSSASAIVAVLHERMDERVIGPLRRTAPEVEIRTEATASVPAFARTPASPAVALALRLTGRNGCIAAPFASEAGLFQAAGIPAVVCGPGRASEAHQPDEYVSRDQIADCLEFLRRLADWASRA
jgi:acetylornithine deacetylase